MKDLIPEKSNIQASNNHKEESAIRFKGSMYLNSLTGVWFRSETLQNLKVQSLKNFISFESGPFVNKILKVRSESKPS